LTEYRKTLLFLFHQPFPPPSLSSIIIHTGVLVVAVVERRTRDRKVAGSTLGGALSSQLGQLSLPSLRGR